MADFGPEGVKGGRHIVATGDRFPQKRTTVES